MSLYQAMENLRMLAIVVAGRVRAGILRLRGAHIGTKVIVESSSRVDRPYAVTMGNRCRLERGVWLKLVSDDARLVLGDNVFLGQGVELDVLERIDIGEHSLIAPQVFITDHSHVAHPGLTIDTQGCVAAPVRVGRDVWIGSKAIILPGVTIGDGAIVGAAAVVRESVDAGAIVAGIPARVIGRRLVANAPTSTVPA